MIWLKFACVKLEEDSSLCEKVRDESVGGVPAQRKDHPSGATLKKRANPGEIYANFQLSLLATFSKNISWHKNTF